jgi:hypothetical protein
MKLKETTPRSASLSSELVFSYPYLLFFKLMQNFEQNRRPEHHENGSLLAKSKHKLGLTRVFIRALAQIVNHAAEQII